MALRFSSVARHNPSSLSAGTGPSDPPIPQSAHSAPRLPLALPIPFSNFNNKYQGSSCHVVGRGRTNFDYRDLRHLTEPIFFINDAICLEKYATSETFFFAHDPQPRVWLNGSIKATAVLPIDGSVLRNVPGDLGHAGLVVYYRRGERNRDHLLRMSRDAVAVQEELFVHTGTIHSLVHFLWFCGFARAVFIGCDGKDGYDPRLQNRSNSSPGQYKTIRHAQGLLTTLFGIEAIYCGTPNR